MARGDVHVIGLSQRTLASAAAFGVWWVPHLAMTTSADTLLRLVRRLPLPPPEAPRVLGVDDWAMRKQRTCGTILVDLERRRVVDLLPDRSATTLAD